MGDYTNLLLEEIRDQNRAVLEAVGDMKEKVKYIPAIREDIASLKSDMTVVKAVIRDISDTVHNHELRIRRFETT